MNLYKSSAEIYVPDGSAVEKALARTTHLAIGAHQTTMRLWLIMASWNASAGTIGTLPGDGDERRGQRARWHLRTLHG